MAKRINQDFIFVDVLTPIPGTNLFKKLEKENKIRVKLFPYEMSYDSLLPKDELRKELFRCYLSFYFRRDYISGHLTGFLKHTSITLKRLSAFLDWKKRGYAFGYD